MGWVCLNTDGATNFPIPQSGGLVRDPVGNQLCGFFKFIGLCSVLEAELQGILEELRLCNLKGFNHVLVPIDSEATVNVILDSSDLCVARCDLVQEIHKQLWTEWEVKKFILSRSKQMCG